MWWHRLAAVALGLGAVSVQAASVQAAPPGALSIDITLRPGEAYADALAAARMAGAGVTSLSLLWDELEPDRGAHGARLIPVALAGHLFRQKGMGVTLTLSVIDTLADRRPADLKGLDWDDPALWARFDAHLTAVLLRLAPSDLRAVSVGNEVDGFLAGPEDIAAYGRFVARAADRVRGLRPGVPVGAKITAFALMSDAARWQPVLAAGDVVMTTYYPLGPDFAPRPPDAPLADLPLLVEAAGGKPLMVLEAGYPSDGCGSSPAAQADFVRALFSAWKSAGAAVPLVSLTWLNDLTAAELAQLTRYYGVTAPCFETYLSSLGLRDGDGRAKPALVWLQDGAR